MDRAGDSGTRRLAVAPEAWRDDPARDWAPGPGDARGVSPKATSGKAFCPGFMALLWRVAPGGGFPAHPHDHVHVFTLLEGSGPFSTEGREFPGGPGTVARIPPQVAHGCRYPGPGVPLPLVIDSPATR